MHAGPPAVPARLPTLRVATPFEDPDQTPLSQPPSPAAVSPVVDRGSPIEVSNVDRSGSESLSYGTPVATPSGARTFVSTASAAFVTPHSMVSAISGTSWMSAAETLQGTASHLGGSVTPEGTCPEQSAPLPPPRPRSPDSPEEWRAPRRVEPALIIEVDEVSMQCAAGMHDGSVTVHIQDAGVWEAAPTAGADEGGSASPARGHAAVFRGPRGMKVLHSTAAPCPPTTARTPGSMATLSRSPSLSATDRGLHLSAPPHRSASFRLPNVRPRPSITSDALLRHDSLPHSARRSSHLDRSPSLSLLQVQGSRTPAFPVAPTFDTAPYGPPPLVSVSTCMATMHTGIAVTPFTATITPGLIELGVRFAKPFGQLLPLMSPRTAAPLPPHGALLAAADAAAEVAFAPHTVSLRMHGVSAGVVLPKPNPGLKCIQSGATLVPQVFIGEVNVEHGSSCSSARIARMRDDVAVAHAHACAASTFAAGWSSWCDEPSPRSGAGSEAGAEGLAGGLWAHAGAAGAVRLPTAALAAALTVPIHATLAEVSLDLHQSAGGVMEDEEADPYAPGVMGSGGAAAGALLMVAEASVTASVPAAQFTSIEVDVRFAGLRSTVTGEDVTRVREAIGAGETLAQLVAPGAGSMGAGATRLPWLQVRGTLDDVWLRAAGACVGHACVEATLASASATCATPCPCAGTAAPQAHAASTFTVAVQDLALSQLSGTLEAVMPAAAPFVPRGIRTAALRAVLVHISLDAATGQLQHLVGEACGLRVTADVPVATQSGFWDASEAVCVIGTSEAWPSGAAGCGAEETATAAAALEAPAESLVRVAFAPPDTAEGSDGSSAEGPLMISVLICNACVSTLFLAEIISIVNGNSAPPANGAGEVSAEAEALPGAGAAAVCTSVEIVRSELAAPSPAGRPGAAARGSDGGAALRLGRVAALLHPGWLEEDPSAAHAAVVDLRRCAQQAEWLKCAQPHELADVLYRPFHGAVCVLRGCQIVCEATGTLCRLPGVRLLRAHNLSRDERTPSGTFSTSSHMHWGGM